MPRRHRRRRLSGVSLNTSFQDTPARQESSADLSEADASFLDLGENDDTAERSRIRTRVRQQQTIAGAITPVPSTRRNRSNRSRAGSASPYLSSGLASSSGVRKRVYSNEQLSQIYKDCIIKAQTGKINQQNAWTLHLVDNIQEITDLEHDKENQSGGGNGGGGGGGRESLGDSNAFARASHTIDAASKIYGYRVDSVHNTTYKVLGSIHQQNNDDADGAGGNHGGGTVEELLADKRRKQRNRNVGRSTLCEADKLHKLDESMKSLCVEVDALFHKTASCFDEGGAKGLLMNTLYVQNGCDIVFDSQTKIEQNADLIHNGVQVDESCVADTHEIEKESAWMTQLCADTFGSKFDGFTQIDTNASNAELDISTQTKPQNFVVDMDWIQQVAICPLLSHFEQEICAIGAHLSSSPSAQAGGDASEHISPEKDYAADAVNDFAADDDDVMLDMPDFNAFTIGPDQDLNAQDLFHEELMTQQQQQQHAMVEPQPIAVGDVSRVMQMDVSGVSFADGGGNIEYIAGQNSDQIGNMGVEVLLNQSAFRDDDALIDKLQHEQNNDGGQFSHLHTRGIYKRGAMNIAAMNQVIAKLENADFESLTSFFDAKKHGNWAGPDQWYHRRYQLTLQAHDGGAKSPNKSRAGSRRQSVSPQQQQQQQQTEAPTQAQVRRARKERASTRFDFMSIANGQLIDDAEFEEPNRSHNTLTQAVLDKNKKTYHTLPKDLQIKPDIFIKLFYRPNYSVWRHWMNQHRQRMQKINADAAAAAALNGEGGDGDAYAYMDGAGAFAADDADVDMGMGMGMALAANEVGADMMMTTDPECMKQAAIAAYGEDIVAQNDDDENEFKYNYNNPLDVSHFVPEVDPHQGGYDFNLNGYDLVEVDAGKQLEKIKVEFASTAKKVNVRKLKMKLWEKIDSDLKNVIGTGTGTEEKMDMDMDMDNAQEEEEQEEEPKNGAQLTKEDKQAATFQDTLNTLPNNISSSISVQMCFICLLHLANEKELQLVPSINLENNELERGNFKIESSNENSTFEKEAEKINPIMVLGK